MELTNLKRLASQDSLTGLYNHKAAKEMIENMIAQRENKEYAVILIDVDYFKSANDQHGHIFGDEVLKYIS